MQSSGVITRRTVFRPVSYPSRPPPYTSSMTSSSMTSSSPDDDMDQIMPVTSRHLRGGSVPPLRAGSVPPQMSRNVPSNENGSGSFVVKERFSLNGPSFSPWTANKARVTRSNRLSLNLSDPDEDDSYSAAATRARYLAEIKKAPTLDIDSAYSKLISSFAPSSSSDSATTKYSSSLTPTAELAIRQAHRNLDRIEHDIKTDTKCPVTSSSTRTIKTTSNLDTEPLSEQNSSFVGPLTNLLSRSSSPGMYSYNSSETSLPFLRKYFSSNIPPAAEAPPPMTASSYRSLMGELSTPLNVSTQFYQKTPSDQTTKVSATSPSDLSLKYGFSIPLDIAAKYNLTTTLDDLSTSYMPLRKTSIRVDHSSSFEPQVENKTRKQTVNLESKSYPTMSSYRTRAYSDLPSSTLTSVDRSSFKPTTRHSSDALDDNLEALIRSARTLPEVPSNYQRKSSASSSSGRKSAPLATTPMPTGLLPLFKPQISDTRRHVRDVLCKVKGDPNYFN